MILSIILTLLFIVLVYILIKEKKIYKFKEVIVQLQNSTSSLNDKYSIFLLLAFGLFLVLPLFWGLSFYLRTDYNVVIVVFFLFWSYNWIKYIYFKD